MSSVSQQSAFLLGLCLLGVLPSPTLSVPTIGGSVTPEGNSPFTEGYKAPASYTGDALNVTKCFCEDAGPRIGTDDPRKGSRWGHYFQVDYYNFHLDTLYSLSWTCDSHEAPATHAFMPFCWDRKRLEHRTKRYPDGNVLHYDIGFQSIFDDGLPEHYWFNAQRRGLPKKGHKGNLILSPDACEGFCRDEVKGMVAAKDATSPKGEMVRIYRGTGGHPHKIKSTITSYTEIDDMCEKCK